VKNQLQQRLNELKAEFEAGQRLLADLDAKRANLQESMLRISGAIQVLEEELAKSAQAAGSDEKQSEART
jgi:hypothetical protein